MVIALKFVCIRCNKEFEAKRKTVVCPDCRTGICAVCGKLFELSWPWTQNTCSSKCRGEYRRISGAGKSAKEKAKATLKQKYGTDNLHEVQSIVGIKLKICKLCGKEFVPDTARQEYCKIHYLSCPICGKEVIIADHSKEVKTCSEKCRVELIKKTCTERYGNECVLNSEYGREKSKATCMEKYGVEAYSSTDEYKERFRTTCIDKFGVEYPMQSEEIQQKAIATNMERYGVEYPLLSPEIREKAVVTTMDNGGFSFQRESVVEKIMATNLERYGTIYPTQNEEVKKKTKETNNERYNADYPSCSGTEVRERIEATNLERYGSITAFGSGEIHSKSVQSLQEHYGVSNPMESEELRKKSQENLCATMQKKYGKSYSSQIDSIKQKISDTIYDRYGVPGYCMTQDCSQHNYRKVSHPNQLFAEQLSLMSVSYEFEKYIGHTSYDIYLPEMNMLVEINPTYTHNSIGNHWGNGRPESYHWDKTKLAIENGFRCMHIFDWDNLEKILMLIKPKFTIYARKCTIREVSEVEGNEFLNIYHLQNTVRGQSIRLGLYYNEQLVEIMTFGKPRYNKHYQWELLRLCSHSDYKIIGGASRLFKRFINTISPESIISYCDLSKFSGSVYNSLRMKLDHKSNPAKVWSKKNERITDNLLRQRGYDQLFGTEYGTGVSNEALMLENGWLPVYDCGQAVYTWKKSL